MLPLEFFDLENENSFFGLKSLELLQDKKFIQRHSVSYFASSEDKNIMLLTDQKDGGSIALDITNVQIVTDEFENSWFYLEGHFEGEMYNSEMLYYPVYEYHDAKEDERKLKVRNGHFSALHLVEGQTAIKAQ